MLDYNAAPGAIHGYDFAGTTVALEADALTFGHRVSGIVHGMNKLQADVGVFAEYAGACADSLLKVPDYMSFEAASTNLFSKLRVPASLDQHRGQSGEIQIKAEDREFVLVAGENSQWQTRAIQLLKL